MKDANRLVITSCTKNPTRNGLYVVVVAQRNKKVFEDPGVRLGNAHDHKRFLDACLGAAGRSGDAAARADLDSQLLTCAKVPPGDGDAPGPTRDLGTIVSRALAEIETQEVGWIWRGWIPAGMLSILDGDPSEGKSLITIDAAARCTRGGPMPLGAGSFEPGGVLLMAAEDSVEHTIKPRAEAAGADVDLFRVCECIRIGNDERPIRLPEDIVALEREIKAHKSRLTVIDPLLGFLSQAIDSHKDQSVRDVLHQLKLLAARTGCAILGLRHLGKANAGGNALYRGMGSIAITAAARSAFTVGQHPTEQDVRVMASTKINLVDKSRSLAYRIKSERGHPLIDWLYECDVTAADLGQALTRTSGGALEAAKDFLRDLLANGRQALANDVKTRAAAAGIAEATLNRAKTALGIDPQKEQFSGRWVWALPREGAQPRSTPEDDQRTPG